MLWNPDLLEKMMETWVEVESTYLTDQPLIWVGGGKGHKQVPDPDSPPTKAYMFTYCCTRTKKGVRRRRKLEVLRIERRETNLDEACRELEALVDGFCYAENTILINSPENSNVYINGMGEPDEANLR